MKGYSTEQLLQLKIQSTLKIIDKEEIIELSKIYALMALNFGVTQKRVEQYLEILVNAGMIKIETKKIDDKLISSAYSLKAYKDKIDFEKKVEINI